MRWATRHTMVVERGRTARWTPTAAATLLAPLAAVIAALWLRPGVAVAAQVGTITDSRLKEVSGIAASARNPGTYWVHNDSGDGPFVHAIEANGRRRATYRVRGANALDWEDMAVAKGQLLIGDIGDNFRFRPSITVYRFPEPTIPATSAPHDQLDTETAVALRLVYPDGRHDAESLAVDPSTGDVYIFTKEAVLRTGVYRWPNALRATSGGVLERLTPLPRSVRGPITGGDISPAGDALVVRNLGRAYVFRTRPESTTSAVSTAPVRNGPVRNGPVAADLFQAVLAATPQPIRLPSVRQGEAICFTADGTAVVTTTEGLPARVDEVALPISR